MAAGDISKAMLAEIRSRIGEAATSGLSDNEVYYAINNGQFDLAERLCDSALPGLWKTASGSLTATVVVLPTDCLRPRALQLATIWAKYVPVAKIYTLATTGVTPASATEPYWTMWYDTDAPKIKGQGCAATAAYVLYYVTVPVTATTDVDPLFWAPRRELVKEFALAECLRLRQRHEEAAIVRGGYETKIAAINSRYVDGQPYDGLPGDVKYA